MLKCIWCVMPWYYAAVWGLISGSVIVIDETEMLTFLGTINLVAWAVFKQTRVGLHSVHPISQCVNWSAAWTILYSLLCCWKETQRWQSSFLFLSLCAWESVCVCPNERAKCLPRGFPSIKNWTFLPSLFFYFDLGGGKGGRLEAEGSESCLNWNVA